MNKKKILELLKDLLKNNNIIYAPVMQDSGNLLIQEINNDNINKIDYSACVPHNSFKEFLLPNSEDLFEYKNNEFIPKYKPLEDKRSYAKNTVLFGVNVLDLKALTLLDHIFEKDIFYQFRRNNIIVIGLSTGIPEDFRKYKVFSQQFEENILEHLIFDIFLEKTVSNKFKLLTGSRKGQQILEHFNLKEYEHVQFAGLVPETGVDKIIEQNKDLIEKGFDNPVWDKLGKICLACGKCSLVCPTCFCFNSKDYILNDKIIKKRKQTTCFFDDFTRVAGGHRFLDNARNKLYFWYYHKFVRIPDELQIAGCVSCMRCIKACPVGINIIETLKELKNNKK